MKQTKKSRRTEMNFLEPVRIREETRSEMSQEDVKKWGELHSLKDTKLDELVNCFRMLDYLFESDVCASLYNSEQAKRNSQPHLESLKVSYRKEMDLGRGSLIELLTQRTAEAYHSWIDSHKGKWDKLDSSFYHAFRKVNDLVYGDGSNYSNRAYGQFWHAFPHLRHPTIEMERILRKSK